MIYKNPNKVVLDAAAMKKRNDWMDRSIALECDCIAPESQICKTLQASWVRQGTEEPPKCECECHE